MLISLGLDFQRAPLAVRERFHLDDEGSIRTIAAIQARGASEVALTRTCNRVEAYSWWGAESPATGADGLAREIGLAWVGGDVADAEALLAHARVRSAQETARHLFRVASGLESQIVGDIHILGQVRAALREAVDTGSVGTQLHRLFEMALHVGRRVKRETRLTATRSSVGSEAARYAAERRGGLRDCRCVVIGCGKSGTHAARAMARHGARQIVVLNRTLSRAETLARELVVARAASLDAMSRELADADVVIVATGAARPVVTADAVRIARKAGEGAPLTLIDVSVPRNVEAEVGTLEGVDLIDLDALHFDKRDIERSRLEAVPLAEALVDELVEEFRVWLDLRAVKRNLTPLQDVIANVCRREVSSMLGESARASRVAERIVSRVMAHPMVALREASVRGEATDHVVEVVCQLFSTPADDAVREDGPGPLERQPRQSPVVSGTF